MALAKNEFYDINYLPTSEGIIFLGISMSRIGNAQSAEKCFEYIKHLASKIQYTEGIGAELWYGDYLYFHSEKPASELRDQFKAQMLAHKNALLRLLKQSSDWTLKAFAFKTFGQILLENSEVYEQSLHIVRDLYEKDPEFRTYVEEDCVRARGVAGEREVLFVIEEIAMFYLSQKGSFRFNNKFVTDTDKTWTLQAYPGRPLKSEVYLFQKNPLGFSNTKNVYKDCYYDLERKILYDYSRIDLETFDFS